VTMDLLLDRLQAAAERTPHETCVGGLRNAELWARSGAVASWLIARDFGRSPDPIPVGASAHPDRAVFLVGALRAGALVVIGEKDAPLELDGVSFAALASGSVDAAVAERRLHIVAETPAQRRGGRLLLHGDLASLSQALA
jgi:acyl-CoA synthetase (AMP-forming)/AMP-acid ligase II